MNPVCKTCYTTGPKETISHERLQVRFPSAFWPSRGFIHQVSEPEALDARAAAGPITAYIGFDCTAPSLHVGSLLPIMMLYWMQQTGHRPIALMGGGTTRVGDPSGKDESRKILTDEDIGRNLVGIRAVFDKFLKLATAQAATPSWRTMPTG